MNTSDQRFNVFLREGKGWDLLPGVVAFDATGIACLNEQGNTRLDFATVQRIFLWVEQGEGSAPTWYCGISGGGGHVSIGSSGRFCRTKEGEAQYRDFVLALHRRLSTCAHPIEFATLPRVKRRVVWLFLAGLGIFLCLLIVIPSVTGIAGDSLALWIPLLIALLVYEIALGLKRREKQCYPPGDIPDRLLP
jgi:hypothetical protein